MPCYERSVENPVYIKNLLFLEALFGPLKTLHRPAPGHPGRPRLASPESDLQAPGSELEEHPDSGGAPRVENRLQAEVSPAN